MFQNFSFLDLISDVLQEINHDSENSAKPSALPLYENFCCQVTENVYVRYVGNELSVDYEWGRQFTGCKSSACKLCSGMITFLHDKVKEQYRERLQPNEQDHLHAMLVDADIKHKIDDFYPYRYMVIRKPNVKEEHTEWQKRLSEVYSKLKVIDSSRPFLHRLLGEKHATFMDGNKIKDFLPPQLKH